MMLSKPNWVQEQGAMQTQAPAAHAATPVGNMLKPGLQKVLSDQVVVAPVTYTISGSQGSRLG